MFTYDDLRRALSDWPWLRRSVVFVVVTLGLAVLYPIVLTAVAYYQDGVIAGYAFGQNIHLPRNTIIMVEEECTTLPGWVPYAKAAGRMPIGAGTGSDINNVARIFRVQDDDDSGEYVHTLTVPRCRRTRTNMTAEPLRRHTAAAAAVLASERHGQLARLEGVNLTTTCRLPSP